MQTHMLHHCRLFLAGLLLTLSCSVWASPTFASIPPDDGTPNLWLAAYQGDTETIGQLLAQGRAIDDPDPNGISPLIHALRQRQYAAAELLLRRGANASQTDRLGFTALSFAFWAGLDYQDKAPYDERWLKLLLEHGADIHAAPKHRTPLLTLVATTYPPRPDALKFVLDRHPRIDQRSGNNCTTALMSTVFRDSQYRETKNKMVRMLLDAGASINLTEITNHTVGTDRSYPTPLLYVTRRFSYGSQEQDELVARLALLDLLLKHGANPRFGGIGGEHENHQDENCHELPENGPGTSGSAASEWSDFSGGAGNPALTEALGNTAAYREAFDRIITAASPISAGEIGYPALDMTMARYTQIADSIEMIDSAKPPNPNDSQKRAQLEARRADLEYALRTLIDLGTPLNPSHVLLQEGNWQELWIARTDMALGGIEHLPLFEYRMPDDIYLRLLQGGASPAIRPGGHFSSPDTLVTHLIKKNAASKLTMLNEHLGLLERVPSWCGRTVRDIEEALVRQPSPTVAAKRILLKLLRNPNCTAREEEMRQRLPELFRQLNDSKIEPSFGPSPEQGENPDRSAEKRPKNRPFSS